MVTIATFLEITSTAADDIKALNSDHSIHLGGSRRMAERCANEIPDLAAPHQYEVQINPKTDWDYYTTHSSDLELRLIKLGWDYTKSTIETQNGGDYLDSEAVCILYKDDHEIVLRKNAEFYRTVFENIPVWFYAKFLWKSTPYSMVERQDIQPIFEMLFEMYRRFGNVKPS